MLYEMTCLPFGISIAPFLFTQICKPVFSWFRAQSISCTFYIDDILEQIVVNGELLVVLPNGQYLVRCQF